MPDFIRAYFFSEQDVCVAEWYTFLQRQIGPHIVQLRHSNVHVNRINHALQKIVLLGVEMKKVSVLFACAVAVCAACLLLGGCGQTQDVYALKEWHWATEQNPAEGPYSDFKINDDGKVIHKRLIDQNNSNKWSDFDYEYDDSGKLVKETETLYSGGTNVTNYIYDDKGFLSQIQAPDGTKNYSYSLDEQGRVASETILSDNGHKLVYEFTYDAENGRIIRQVCTSTNTSGKTNTDVSTFEYDNSGNPIREKYEGETGKLAYREMTFEKVGSCKVKDGVAQAQTFPVWLFWSK